MPLGKANPLHPLSIDNIATQTDPPTYKDQSKVSVIVPTYNSERTLPFVLRALLNQTWYNLEIIIVDDCSLDNTFAVAESYAFDEPRVIAVQQKTNQGAYVARDLGLELATGQFITTNDSDDWSHPERIERQIVHILGNPQSVANCCFGARVSHNLRFSVSPFRSSAVMVHRSMVSAMFRKEIFELCGPWDTVRVGADKELIDRIRYNIGEKRIAEVLKAIPLLFSVSDAQSLTGNKVTHLATSKYGVRREYRESAAHWRASSTERNLYLDVEGKRPFPAPRQILPNRQCSSNYDMLLAMDFNLEAPALTSIVSYVIAAAAQGFAVALFQWNTYEADTTRSLNPAIRQMAQEGKVELVAPGEKVSVSTVIVGSISILKHVVDLFPEVTFSNLLIIVDETALRECDDPQVLRANLTELFGSEGIWIPINESARQRMKTDQRYPQPHGENWTPMAADTT